MHDPSRAAAMPDPMAKWTPAPDWRTTTIIRDGWSAKPMLGLSIVSVGGHIAGAIAALAREMQELGLWQVAVGPDYVVRIARDKALIVTSSPQVFQPGWNPEGWSATQAESAYGVIDITGAALPDIISEATAADIDTESRSAAVLFAGIPCCLMRSAPNVARLHVEIGYMPYLWRWLETRPPH